MGGSAALAASEMINIFRREGGRQVDTGTYDADKPERLRLSGWLSNGKCVAVWKNVSFAFPTRARRHPSFTGRQLHRWHGHLRRNESAEALKGSWPFT